MLREFSYIVEESGSIVIKEPWYISFASFAAVYGIVAIFWIFPFYQPASCPIFVGEVGMKYKYGIIILLSILNIITLLYLIKKGIPQTMFTGKAGRIDIDNKRIVIPYDANIAFDDISHLVVRSGYVQKSGIRHYIEIMTKAKLSIFIVEHKEKSTVKKLAKKLAEIIDVNIGYCTGSA